MKKTFLVVYEKGRKNFGGFAPDVPGCGALGDTLEEVRADLQTALQLYIDTCTELGHTLPEPVSNSVTLPIAGETDPAVTYTVERITVNVPKPKTSKPRLATTKRTPSKRRAMQAA
jgi:predicted RNase H-like HicB family nuclease